MRYILTNIDVDDFVGVDLELKMRILPQNGDRHTNTDSATISTTWMIKAAIDFHKGFDDIIDKNVSFPQGQL